MMNCPKNKIIAVAVTVLVHVALVVFLVLMTVANAAPQHEGGIEVMFGDFELAGEGIGTPSALAEAPLPPDETLASEDQPLLTQDEEPSVAIDENSEPAKEQESPEPEKTKEQLRAEHERRVAAQADKLMSSAFGKGASMGGGGDGGERPGVKGSPDGNSASGATAGVGGYGSFSLAGRSLGDGTLPPPSYDVEDEGVVVVDIWVAPSGKVVRTAINAATNTYNTSLRSAAERAASRAVFNQVQGADVQRGTITYVFNLK